MYEGHGMTRQIALDAAADVMRVPEAALAVHAREELGVDPDELGSPWSAAGLSLICFLVGCAAAGHSVVRGTAATARRWPRS